MTTESEKLRPPGPCKHGPNKEFQATDGIRCGQCAWDGYVWAVELLDEKDQKILDLELKLANKYANAERVIEWINDPTRKPAILAFTEGPERQIAYAVERIIDEKDLEIKSLKTRYSELEEQTGLMKKENLVRKERLYEKEREINSLKKGMVAWINASINLEKQLQGKEQEIRELLEALIWAKNVIREWDTDIKDEKEDLGFILKILAKHLP